ncbi:MAG: heavy-metal-associated domain-containing protein [archaeon]
MIAEFKVSGMHCPSCPKLIKMNLEELQGVKDVKADEKTGVVKVTFDEKKVNAKEIAKQIEQGEYKILQTKEKK